MFLSSSFLYAVLFRALFPPSAYPFISGKCLLPLVLNSTQNLEGRHPTFSTQTVKQIYCYRFYSHHTERLFTLESSDPQRSDEQQGRTDRHLAPGQEGGSEEQEGEESRLLTWLQTGLYLSPGLFRIFSSCLWLKLDTPMDLVSPASLHFSRAWEGGVVNSHEQSLGMGNRIRINAEKHQ